MNSDGSVVIAAYPQTFYGAGPYAQAAPFDPSPQKSAQIPEVSKLEPTGTAFGCYDGSDRERRRCNRVIVMNHETLKTVYGLLTMTMFTSLDPHRPR
ncbi:unnamed protein product [Nippostrongylus brasiliensis]|uniref:Uncharacterized protein n=1 Tax=Nippostrongylus brasiliensis TaxID=27835 RepID=A0A0N4YFE8_NIPBR|nr:unnamed protein product [Nippostrongylus brasiliensis]